MNVAPSRLWPCLIAAALLSGGAHAEAQPEPTPGDCERLTPATIAPMQIRLAQFEVRRDLASDTQHILSVLDQADPGEALVFPEGADSGYEPADPEFLRQVDPTALSEAIQCIHTRVVERRCHCLVGSATTDGARWWNSVLLLGENGAPHTYHEVELSALDRRHFQPGSTVGDVVQVGTTPVGLLACRELLFPAAWMELKHQGARVVFHLNNAMQPKDAAWLHVLLARAIELGVFVCSVDDAAPSQQLPSLLIAPVWSDPVADPHPGRSGPDIPHRSERSDP